jgi:hypothetical protein
MHRRPPVSPVQGDGLVGWDGGMSDLGSATLERTAEQAKQREVADESADQSD